MTFRGNNHLDGFVPGEFVCASGIVNDVIYGTKFGRNFDVDAAEDIISMGGDYLGQPLNGLSVFGVEEDFRAVSDSTSDASGGTGALGIRITYLDDAGEWREASVDLDGTTPVTFGVSGIRCFRAFVTVFGSSGANAGTITITHAVTTSRVFAEILPGSGQSEVAVLTIPVGHIGVLSSPMVKVDRGGSFTADVSVRVRRNGQGGYLKKNIIRQSEASASFPDPALFYLPPLTDVKLRVEAISASNADIAGQFNYLIFKQ